MSCLEGPVMTPARGMLVAESRERRSPVKALICASRTGVVQSRAKKVKCMEELLARYTKQKGSCLGRG